MRMSQSSYEEYNILNSFPSDIKETNPVDFRLNLKP